MSVNTNLCNDFLDAMQMISTSSVERAGYDKTIQAQVLSCQDATIGKYRCRFQDSTFYAYAGSSDVTFSNGAYVYILVPGNDMSKEKTILGTTQKLGINYISQAEGDEAYDTIGNNCVTSNNKFYLDTNNKDYKYTIYAYNQSSPKVTLDTTALGKYIKESSSLIVGATFKTSIPIERQARGHYGITFTLRFLDNTSNKQVLRSYTVDEDNMVDNPYRLVYNTRQYQIFDIDGPNFSRVESIQIFNNDFPGAEGTATETMLSSGDIEITKLELFGAVRMSESEVDGVAVSFYTPQGTFFPSNAAANSYRTITAQVRVKGKLVSQSQKIPFYWGVEDVGISPRSQYYNKYLGRGWKCLNQRNVISKATTTADPVVEWVPGKSQYILKIEDATARDNRIKVAVVYDNNVITKQVNIQNLGARIVNLTITSTGGTTFYHDIGHPTLTCKIDDRTPSGYIYHWAYENKEGALQSLDTTTQQNNNYHNAVNNLNNLRNAIAAGTKFPNAEKNNLANLEAAVKAFDYIQRVEGNSIYDVQINNITDFGTFKCSVYVDNPSRTYVGTSSIKLVNSLKGEGIYSLVINNGATTFQYNEDGIAPNSKSLDVPQQIQGLSFTIYDNLGNAIDDSILTNTKNCKIKWFFPIKQTMLVDQNGGVSTDPTQNYIQYDNRLNLVYGIAQRYDIKKQRNQIKLNVNYKGMNLVAETSFTFAKQGQPGTNGTQYIVKLVPRTTMSTPPRWPMITRAGGNYFINYGIGTTASEQSLNISSNHQLFKAQLWRSGELVWEGLNASTSAIDGITKPTVVNWQMLVNKYKSNVTDASLFTVADAGNGYFKFNGISNVDTLKTPYANIVKCSITWQGKTYYGTLPVTTAWTSSANYRINLKDYTGWRYAVYTNDGVLPQYDSSHPFEFIMTEKINGIEEDISLVSGSHATTFDTPVAISNYKQTGDGTTVSISLIEVLTSSTYRSGCAKNQWRARPVSKYDGICVNAAIYQTCKNNGGAIIGRISVPIHFLLNKYGMSNINAWDGNSVQLDDEGGFVLAPQVGAGEKNSSNQFTGVLMGQTRVPGKNTPQIGLLGYSKGDRTFFLNSKNGSALFGKNNGGQIAIDPSSDYAMLYNHGFWKNYNTDNDNDGLPTSYTYRTSGYVPSGNCSGSGMLIDLKSPEIFFGSGNFYVNKDGHVHAGGGGDIGGWLIGNTTLQSSNKTITLDSSGNGKIYSGSHSTLSNNPVNGFYLGTDGLSIGSKAKLTSEGVMYIGNGAVAGNSKNHWTIDGNSDRSYITYGASSPDIQFNPANSDSDTTSKVYLGTDGFSLGKRFSVSSRGELITYSGIIGGWTITKNKLSANNIQISSGGSIQTTNFQSGQETGWQISSSGQAIFNNVIANNITANNKGYIGGWTITSTSLKSGNIIIDSGNGAIHVESGAWSINDNGSATFNDITANVSGKIGGWSIGKDDSGHNSLSSGGITISSGGSIKANNGKWKITAGGDAHFDDITLSGKIKNGGSLSGNGMSIGGGGGAGSSINPGAVGYTGGSGIGVAGTLGNGLFKAYEAEFNKIYAKQAEIDDVWIRKRLKYNNHTATWGAVAQSVSVSGTSGSVTVEKTTHHYIKSITVKLTRTHGLVDAVGADDSSDTYSVQ